MKRDSKFLTYLNPEGESYSHPGIILTAGHQETLGEKQLMSSCFTFKVLWTELYRSCTQDEVAVQQSDDVKAQRAGENQVVLP